MPPSPIPYPLRMPEELREYLTTQAKQHNRSLHAEILGILQDAMGETAPAPAALTAVPMVDVDALADALAERLAPKLKAP